MKKIFLIGWKDVVLAFRDKAGLLLMLVAPFLLTLGLGFVTGRFSGPTTSGLSQIPVVIVNQDGGQLGNALVTLFQSKDLATLVSATSLSDPAAARQQVDADQVAAAIVIPAGFTQSIIPSQGAAATQADPPAVQVEMYANPTRPTSSGVVRSILDEFISRVEVGRAGGAVAVTQLISQGLVKPQDAARLGAEIGARQAAALETSSPILIKGIADGSQPVQFDPLAYMAPGMALMFLMYTVSNGGRSLLTEKAQGTLPRLLVTPISTTQVLGGKVFGIFLTGAAQMLILIGGSTLFFNLQWGDPVAVVALVLASVAGAVGWGMLITAVAKTPGQAGTIGSAIFLTFGILGGSFFQMTNLPTWFQVLSKITPNSWGLDGFTVLGLGGHIGEILTPLAALLLMGAVLFTLSVVLLNRRGFAER
jgi:ABC-2 type transport system permease protein